MGYYVLGDCLISFTTVVFTYVSAHKKVPYGHYPCAQLVLLFRLVKKDAI